MYAELHCHSAFSFLDGASLPDELAATAAELGYDALALTDHDSLAGSMELAQAAAAAGIRAIHGAEVTLVDGRHLTLLVEDATGWRNLCRILTAAHAHDRDPHPPPTAIDLECVLAHAEGLVCLSGCAEHGVHDEPTLRRLLEVFGPDHLRVELQRSFQRHDRGRNRALEALAARLGVACVATGDVHAHAVSRAPLQDAFVALRHHSTLDASEPLRRGNRSHVLASPEAMRARFEDHPEAVAEAAGLADRLRFDLTADLGYRYPGAENQHADAELAVLCRAAFDDRYPGRDPRRGEALGRLEEELRVISALGLAGFFLLHRDLLELARDVAVEVRGPSTARSLLPPGRGRGSSVSSIVCYLTGLSHIDPIRNELFLGRFLNEELTALPDIDLDFPRDIREVLIPRIHERYGRERSALVAAFPTFKARGAIRELGKVLGLPPGEIERVARSADPWAQRGVERDVEVALGRRTQESSRWQWLSRLCDEAWGLPRHLSQHSGGMIVSTRPLIDCCPVVPAAMEGRQICQWDKDSCSDAGFLKIDLLGLGMLSAVERCVEQIARVRGERVDLSRIPFDDPATYSAIQDADTMGVFQIESRAQMASLRRTRPETLDDLTVQVAIVRPGPIQGGAVNPYIARRQLLRENPDYEIPYLHPALEPVLRDTLGTIIFQDQVLEVAMAFAGFSPGEAEGLRRAMSRKRSVAAIEAYHRRFIEGAAQAHDVDEATAEQVYSMIVGFSGFGFPKAHGAAFGLLAYQSTWLRVHYAPEFLCALLNEQPMGFYPSDTLAHEAQRRGMEVLRPDVNASELECTVVPSRQGPPNAVRIGLGYLNGARREEMEALLAARRAQGPFRSLGDLASRVGAGRPALELLAWAGACDSLPGAADRRSVLWQLGIAAPGTRVATGTQLSLPLEAPEPPELRPLEAWESMVADYATTGLTLGAHPLALLRPELPADVVSTRDLETLRHEARVRVGGLVVARQRPGTARGIVFILLEDEFGTTNLVVPPEVYESHRLIVRSEPLLLAEGRLEKLPRAGGAINVFVHSLRALDAPVGEAADVVDLAARAAAAAAAARNREHAVDEGAAAAAAGGAVGGVPDFRGVAPPVQSFAGGRRR
ncbi:MAG: Error-prone repair homolog of DNA polymerase III alpha subunit [uncultured Solirubrobacteraceae bacterium]|uniref:DNA-directed DNA polymerase n=1 Tax=uncultured Solirubrobacteraceae bacterium TaxID=1162706 RepID=A0A6J4RTG9_9ACTN|nr:MAG: Error-prone repair homolog of DNA polymerase III alpha subunit [uncultured Solirubrobacteraceae bacterium]